MIFNSCDTNENTQDVEKIWREEGDGTIITNDLPRLQKMIPFQIVFPEYLPDDLKYDGTAYFFEIIELDTDYECVSITYVDLDAKGWIEISEQEIPKEYDVSFGIIEHPETNRIFQVYDVQIVEQGLDKIDTQYSYYWFYDGLLFDALVDGYSQDESRKIIESMIR
ncbi:hypothetical protein ACFLXY_09025 [Chloroflexota bacterium]